MRLSSFSTVIVTCLLIGSQSFAKDAKPLKVVAPDLVIENAEQGAYCKVDEKTHDVDPRDLKPLSVIPRKHSFMFGWRMAIKTSRKSVLVQERSADGKGKSGMPFQAVPKFGYIYNFTDIVAGVGKGKYSKTIFVEDLPVKTFTYEVR